MGICTYPVSSFPFWVSGERVREFCCCMLYALICKIFNVIFTIFFAVVGAEMGAMIGALIAIKTKSSVFHGTAVGAIKGGIFSIELSRIILDLWNSNISSSRFFLSLIDIIAKLLSGRPVAELSTPTMPSAVQMQRQNVTDQVHGSITTSEEVPTRTTMGLSRYSDEKIPRFQITYKHMSDSSGNGISCSICLQDFQLEEMARSLPPCHHIFHLQCIDKWLVGHSSCPLCRREI
ncbi:hypothetical protein ACB092_01G075800 [Castanea dentata]